MSLPLAQLNPEDPISLGLFIAGVVLISAWMLMRIRKRSVNGPDHPTAREHLERYKQQDGVRGDLEGLMVEIEQLAKRLGNQLDTKAMRIEKLIDEADLRIAQLQRALQDQHSSTPGNAPVNVPGAASPEAIAKQLSEVVESPLSTEEQTEQLAADVARLADAGQTPEAIAKQLNEHVGKIELILALRKS
ncbi:MAG: hypothetical protein AAGH99_11710 [Planctomycetota bacterium]